MISKKARQSRILDVVRKNRVESQESLVAFLGKDGIEATQTTLSRDIRELGLVKVRGKYQVPTDTVAAVEPPASILRRTFAQFALHADVSGNIVAIRTSPGNAHSVCVAVDAAGWSEILGTIAGDDTIFLLARGTAAARQLLKKIREFMT